jgi:hypothetical protein
VIVILLLSDPIGLLVRMMMIIFTYWHSLISDLGVFATFVVWTITEMVKDKLKEPVLTAFTPNGDYVAILSSNSTFKVSIAYFSFSAFDVRN